MTVSLPQATSATPKTRPIIFSGPMVRAILEGKTQARRIVKPQPINDFTAPHFDAHSREWAWYGDDGHIRGPLVKCPCVPGDLLWVRETWCEIPPERPAGYFTDPKWIGRRAWYSADNDKPTWGGKWRPSIHMPRWASRLTLIVKSVRIERVQDITEEDARAEGCDIQDSEGSWGDASRRAWFARLWDSIHGPGAWERNDWVWAIDFEREAVKTK